jgi:ABC-type dipeptide/oligopeptide/nickel transport system ATPase subunit
VHTVHDERIKLTSTVINNVAAAFIVAGFVAPAVSGQFSVGSLARIAIGVALHYRAKALLGELK